MPHDESVKQGKGERVLPDELRSGQIGKIVFGGQYSPDFTRNRKLLDLLEGMDQEVVQCRVNQPSWLRRQVELHRLLRACRNSKLIVGGYPSYSSAVTLWLAAKRSEVPLVLDAFIPYFETKVEDRRITTRWSPRAWAIWLTEFVAYRVADIVIVDTESHASYIINSFGISPDKLAIVRVHPTVGEHSGPGVSRVSLPEGVHRVAYIGNYVPLHGVEVIVRAASVLAKRRPDIAFSMVGRGQTRLSAERLAKELRAWNITWIDALGSSSANQVLRGSVICLGIFGGGKKASRVVPHKLVDGLLAGVPVISRTSEACRRLEAASAMVGVPPDDANELARQIELLVDDVPRQRSLARSGRVVLNELYSDDALASQLSQALRL